MAWHGLAAARAVCSLLALGLEDNKDAGCEFQLHNNAVLVLKEVGTGSDEHCIQGFQC